MRRGKYEESDPDEAKRLGDQCTATPNQRIFRYNPGKTLKLFPPKHPYFPKGCESCQKNLKLAYNPSSDKCMACAIIASQALMVMRRSALDNLKQIQLPPTKLKHADNLHTGFLYCGNKDRQNVIKHCMNAEEITVALELDTYLPVMEESAEPQQVIFKPDKPQQKEKKEDRGVKYYTVYSFRTPDGTLYELKCEAIKLGKQRITEHPYFLRKK